MLRLVKKLLIIFFCLAAANDLFGQVLQLRKPTNGAIWPGYSKQMIEWTSENIDNIKIESSLDSGRSWQLVVSSYPAAAQRYEWEVPNKSSDSCFIRISDVSNASTSSSNFKNNPFKIPAAGITVDTLSSVFYTGSIQPLSWTSSGVRKVNIYVSYDNKVTYQKIADSVAATLFYFNWLVPSVFSTTVYFKIEDAENVSLSDISPAVVQVVALPSFNAAKYKGGAFDGHSASNNRSHLIQLMDLSVGDSAFGGETRILRWKQNNVEQVSIRFSADSGTSWTTIVNDYPAGSGAYTWTVPNTPSQKVFFQIVDAKDSTLFDKSDAAFTIRKKILDIIYHTQAGSVNTNTVLPIGWGSGGIQYLKLQMLRMGTLSLIKDSIPAIREVYNVILAQNLTGILQLVLTDMSDSTTSDTSGVLTLQPLPGVQNSKYKGGSFDGHTAISNALASLQLISPKPGDTLSVSARYTIRWKAFNLDRINIRYSKDSGASWMAIGDQIAASAGSFEWKTPNTIGNQYRIKISDAFDSSFFVITAGSFVLSPKKLVQTTDSANWTKGTSKLLEWTSAGVDSVKIEYRFKQNTNWVKLKDSLPAISEAFVWLVPETIQDSVQIRISDITDSTVSNTRVFTGPFNRLVQQVSAQKFRGGSFDGHSLRSNINKIIVQKPVENEVLTGGAIYTIKWSTINLQDSILLQYSVDSGASWITIDHVLASNGQYDWRIPTRLSSVNAYGTVVIGKNSLLNQIQNTGSSSNKCLIRALDVQAGNAIVGISSKPFTITVGDVPLKAVVDFPAQKDTLFTQPGMLLRMNAVSVSGQKVQYFIQSAYASMQGDSLILQTPGTVTIGAYAAASNGYLASDTVYRSFCILPPKPVLTYQGTAVFCSGDSLLLTANISAGTLVWKRNDTAIAGTQGMLALKINQAGIYTSTLVINGCSNNSAPVAIEQSAKPVVPVIQPIVTAPVLCEGDTVRLTSNMPQTRWFLNGIQLADTNAVLITGKSGMYRAVSGLPGCASDSSNALFVQFNRRPDSIKPVILEYCQGGQPVTLQLTKSRGYNFLWYTAPQGGVGNTTAPVVSVQQSGITSYYVSQVQINTGCESVRTPVTVSVKPAPAIPGISRVGDSLLTQPATQYQWFLNNRKILGGNQSVQPVLSRGLYRVEVRKDSSCWVSSPIYYAQWDPLQSSTQQVFQATIYPNPSAGQFFIQVGTPVRYSGYADISITDVSGQMILKARKYVLNELSWKIPVNIRLSKGINTVTIRLNGYAVKNISLIGL